jgi:hypothetical protein
MSPNVAGMATPEQTYRRLAVIRPSVNVDTLTMPPSLGGSAAP